MLSLGYLPCRHLPGSANRNPLKYTRTVEACNLLFHLPHMVYLHVCLHALDKDVGLCYAYFIFPRHGKLLHHNVQHEKYVT